MHERPRKKTVPKPRLKDADLAALQLQGQETIAQLAARKKHPEFFQEPQREDVSDHSKEFANHIMSKLSGKGLKHDDPMAAEQMMKLLQGGSLKNIRRAYVTGKVQKNVKRKRHGPITRFDDVGPIGGAIHAQLGFLDNQPIPRNHVPPLSYLVV